MILEYKLDASESGMKCPSWIENGGYWYNSLNHTLIGITRDNPEFHVPSTVIRLTPQQLEDRQLAIHNAVPMFGEPIDSKSTQLTDSEVRVIIQDWCSTWL